MRLQYQPQDTAEPVSEAISAALGDVLRIMMRSGYRRSFAVDYFNVFIFPAFKHRQLKIFYDARGNPTAYVLWAHLSSKRDQDFKEKGVMPLEIWEWNDGLKLWLIDLVAPDGNFRDIWLSLQTHEFANDREINYLRMKGGSIRINTCKINRHI